MTDCPEAREDRLLGGCCPGTNDRARRLGRPAGRDQPARNGPQVPETHQHDERRSGGKRRPVVRVALPVQVSADHCEGTGEIPMRERDPGVRGYCERARDPRDDFEGDPGSREREALLTASPEYEGVAPLQPNDPASLACLGDHRRVDLVLGRRRPSAPLPDEDAASVGRSALEESGIDEPVIQDHLRRIEDASPAEGDEVRISRARPDDVYDAPGRDRSHECSLQFNGLSPALEAVPARNLSVKTLNQTVGERESLPDRSPGLSPLPQSGVHSVGSRHPAVRLHEPERLRIRLDVHDGAGSRNLEGVSLGSSSTQRSADGPLAPEPRNMRQVPACAPRTI